MKPRKENLEENLCDFGLGINFLDTTPKSQSIKDWQIGLHQNEELVFFKRH